MQTPHPRLWGTFARVLGHYTREKKLFDLETAVHKMTGLTAGRFGLLDRGRIEAGAYADLVLFDAAQIADRASFDSPCKTSAGIHRVWVNGVEAWRDGAASGRRSGRFLAH
jgi:N-acyl-D-amino-acid deacylase